MQNSPIALMRKLAPLYQDCFPIKIVEIAMVNMCILCLSLVSVFICLFVSGLIRCAHARALFLFICYLFLPFFASSCSRYQSGKSADVGQCDNHGIQDVHEKVRDLAREMSC